MSIRVERSIYGRAAWVGPVQLTSPFMLSPQLPRAFSTHDENCNPVVGVYAWPLGGVSVWWRGFKRTDDDGMCRECRDEFAAFEAEALASYRTRMGHDRSLEERAAEARLASWRAREKAGCTCEDPGGCSCVPEDCHCGKPAHVHEGGFTRGLCEDCDAVRCDAYPGACA